MSDAVIIQIITTVGLIIVAVLGNRKLNRISDDASVTRQQTENEHADAPYPNLRDEVTAVRNSVEGMDQRQKHSEERIESFIRDVDRDVRSVRHSLDRHIETADKRLIEIEARKTQS